MATTTTVGDALRTFYQTSPGGTPDQALDFVRGQVGPQVTPEEIAPLIEGLERAQTAATQVANQGEAAAQTTGLSALTEKVAQPQALQAPKGVNAKTGFAALQRPPTQKFIDPQWAAQLDALVEILLKDLDKTVALLEVLAPAVTVFGGAALRSGDPGYALAEEIGHLLGEKGVPARTGGGPGAMEAVLAGFKEALQEILAGNPRSVEVARPLLAGISPLADPQDTRTQGIGIVISTEQKMNEFVDVLLREMTEQVMSLFPFRKLSLIENVRGTISTQGGFGTADEFFETMALAGEGWHHDPMAVAGAGFWHQILDPIRQAFVVDRPLIDPQLFDSVLCSDDAREIVEHVTRVDEDVKGIEEDLHTMADRVRTELPIGMNAVKKMPPATLFVGARKLDPNDSAARVIEQASRLIADAGVATRVGQADDAVARAVVNGVGTSTHSTPVQAFLRPGEEADAEHFVSAPKMTDYAIHREVMTHGINALVVAPGDERTLDQLFTVLVQLQRDKRPKIPVILVGDEKDWGQIMAGVQHAMLPDPTRKGTIAPKDLDLFTITNDPEKIADMVLGR